jgi:hypothetical protein
MRIAICLSGQLRTGIESFPNFRNYIGDLWPNCDFFIHTWDVESYSSVGLSCNRYDKLSIQPMQVFPVDAALINEYQRLYDPKSLVCEHYNDWLCMVPSISGDPHLHSVRQANALKSKFEDNNDFKYEYVIRARPDLIFDPAKSLRQDIAELKKHPRNFCFAQIFDNPVIGNKIDNAFWLGSSYVIDQLSNFELVRANIHPGFSVDGFVHFGLWVTMGLGFGVKRLTNSRVGVYREFHKDRQLDPIKDFQAILEISNRFDPNP